MPQLAEEVELKFAVPEATAALLQARLPIAPIAGKRKARRRLRSTYYDTPELDLRRRGIRLRVRDVDGRRLQTVKCDGPGVGPSGRLECEHEVAGDRPDLTCVEEVGLQALFSHVDAPARLQPLFATEVDRTAWVFDHRGSSIECVLDVGEIRADGRSVPIRELKLELKGGRTGGLFDAADALNRRLALAMQWESKGQRGYALVAGLKPEPPPRPKLSAKMTAGEAFIAIAGACLGHVACHAPLVRRDGDEESVHDMRVAVRRLRAALSAFRPALGDRRFGFEDDLRWLQDELGAVRDWDVFRAGAIGPLRSADEGLALVDEASRTTRGEAYEELCAALDSSRCTALWLDLTRGLRDVERGPGFETPVRKFAKRQLRRRAKKLRKRGRHIMELDAAALHRLRIATKKLRYAAEFFRDLYPKKRMKRAIAAVTGLQDLLGELNDARTARHLLDRLGPHRGPLAPAFAHATGLVEGAALARTSADRRSLARRWRRYETTKRPWG